MKKMYFIRVLFYFTSILIIFHFTIDSIAYIGSHRGVTDGPDHSSEQQNLKA